MFHRVKEGIADLYYVTIPEHVQNTLIGSLSILDSCELEIYKRYKCAWKKNEFLVGRSLVKSILAAQLETRPCKIGLKRHLYGKLYLDISPDSPYSYLKFNLSHSSGLVACAVALRSEIGVDVERPSQSIVEMSSSLFADGEVRYIKAHPPEVRNIVCYRLWTLKEAYLKANGLGLGCPLDTFDVLLVGPHTHLYSFTIEGFMFAIAVAGDNFNRFRVQVSKLDLWKLLKYAST